MRVLAGVSEWLSHPRIKAAWVTLAAGSLAGLAFVGACSDNTIASKIEGPGISAPRLTGVVGAVHHRVTLCVDALSSPGTYNFSVVVDPASNPLELPTSSDPDYSGIGIIQNSLGPFIPGDAIVSAPAVTPGNCTDVFIRDETVNNANNRMWQFPNQGTVNPYGQIRVTATIPGGYTYSVTCTNDDPNLPQTPGCGPVFPWDATKPYQIGDAVTYNGFTWRAKTANTNVSPVAGPDWEVLTLPLSVNQITTSANVFHGSSITYKYTAPPPPAECVLGYPYGTLPAKTATLFNESEVLSSYGRAGNEIRVWYTDEHALTLGVDSLWLKNKAPVVPAIVTATYPIETMGLNNPASASSSPAPILTGSAISAGLRSALDGFDRPLRPAMFITDLTVNGASSTLGDWQIAGGVGVAPNAVYGSWKGAVIAIDSTKAPPQKLIKPRADPAKNHKNVGGPPAVPPPAVVQDLGYSAEIVWNISDIPGFDPTHNYRLQFMVHDGDQNKTGGDVGQACLNVGPGSPDPLVVISPAAKLN